MKAEHFDPLGRSGLPKLAERAEISSEDALESQGLGFAFPVHKKIRTMQALHIPTFAEGGEQIDRAELLKVSLRSVKNAWEKAIEPRIGAIRNKAVEEKERKEGNDFFTEADVESEKLIVGEFTREFGEQNLQFYGEEVGGYSGNPDANITVRIDPIDGTHTFKFGKQDWCIMVGVYEGKRDAQEQIVASVFSPERNELFYYVKDIGAFSYNQETGESTELLPVEGQDDLRELIVSFYAHAEFEQRGKDDEIIKTLGEQGAEVKMFSSGTEVLEAFMTRGKRILIFDGDMDQTDYIPLSMLVRAGYKIYEWGADQEIRPEDPALDNKKVVIVPPGQAGLQVRELIAHIHTKDGPN
ncbi:MAG: uncharacterized protein JWM46_840 [Candidatus Kaiserbacteria bacterium]|nr:uncharacterized protein [Candidatus Kaiserbacteria bacterium]